MKKIIAILPIVIFLVSVAFASASLNINETNINATANPGATFSKQITLINTESSPLAVTFSGLDLFCGSEKITATTSAMTIPANSTAKSSILFSIPANKLACAYHGNIIAQAGSFADGVTADITVTAVPNIDVSNRSVTLMKNLSSIVFLNAAVKNTGNVPLNIVYQYSNFSRSGKVLEIGSVGSDVVPIGDIHYISIPLVTPDNSFGDGDFTSILKINGTIDRQYGLTATVKTPALTVSLPDFTMPEADRNTTVTGTFTIKNNGDFPLSGITLSTDANSKYHVEIVDVPDALSPGEEATVSITVFIPKDEKTTAHEIGNLLFKSDLLSNTVPLSINVTGKLKIEEVLANM